MVDESPRSGDERFFTPRMSARAGGYTSSGDEKFCTPRGMVSARSTDETPRYTDAHSSSSEDNEEWYSTREDPRAAAGATVLPAGYSLPAGWPSGTLGGVPVYDVAPGGMYAAPIIVNSGQYPTVAAPLMPAAYPNVYGGPAYAVAPPVVTPAAAYSVPSAVASAGPGGRSAPLPPRTAWGPGTSGPPPATGGGPPPARRQSSDSSTDSAGGSEDGGVADIFSMTRHNRFEAVQALLEKGVPANVRDSFGNTILIIACQNGLKRMAKVALRYGADINAVNSKGNTALHFCFTYGFGDTLGDYLISKGADCSIRNHEGRTPREGIGH